MLRFSLIVTPTAPDTVTAVSVGTLTRSDNGQTPNGVTLPIALSLVSGAWTASFSDSNPPPYYNYSFTLTFGDGSTAGPTAAVLLVQTQASAAASQLQLTQHTGQALYLLPLNTSGKYFNATAGGYEVADPTHWNNYAVPLTEPVAGSGIYFASVPAGLPAGLALFPLYLAAIPGTPASTDSQIIDAAGKPVVYVLDWDGSAIKTFAPLGSTTINPQIALPVRDNSLAFAQSMLDKWLDAEAQIAGNGLASVTIDGQQTVWTNAKAVSDKIVYWRRRVALLSGRRRRVATIRMDNF